MARAAPPATKKEDITSKPIRFAEAPLVVPPDIPLADATEVVAVTLLLNGVGDVVRDTGPETVLGLVVGGRVVGVVETVGVVVGVVDTDTEPDDMEEEAEDPGLFDCADIVVVFPGELQLGLPRLSRKHPSPVAVGGSAGI